MRQITIVELSVAEIMSSWPSTIGVFLKHRTHCIGCPISPFHTLIDAADEHGLPLDGLVADVEDEVRRVRFKGVQAPARRR